MARKTALFLATAVLLGCGSSDEPPKPGGATRTDPPVAVCEASHAADGPACEPKFDACGGQELATLGGGCQPVGVTASACAPGFVHDGKGGCIATLPGTACPDGTMALPGMTACEPIADCGTGTFGTIPDSSTTVHVDGAYVGGASDGSRAKPFTKVNEALARVGDGGVVAIAAGTYVEDLVVGKSIRLVGRCPSMVTIQGVSSGERDGTVLVTAPATIASVSLTGPATGLIIDATANAKVDSIRVHGSTVTTGIWVRKGATAASLRRVLVDNVKNYGVIVSGSTAKLEGVHIHDVREDVSAVGLRVNPDPTSYAPAEATVSGSLIEKNDYANVQTVSAKLTIDGSVIRDGVPTGGEWGVGVLVSFFAASKTVAEATVRRSLVERNTYIGILARDGKLVVEDTVVRDTMLEPKEKNYGRGIVAQGVSGKQTQLTVTGSLVERNFETGIDVNGDATARIERSIVRGTKPNGETGTGVFGEVLSNNAPDVTIEGCLFDGNPHGGVITTGRTTIAGSRFERNGVFSIAARGAELTLLRSLIHDSRPGEKGLDGHAVYAMYDRARLLSPKVTIEDSSIRKAIKGGVVVLDGALTMRRSAIREVRMEAASGEAGVGIAVERDHPDRTPTCDVSSTLIDDVDAVGVAVMGADAKLSAIHVRNVRVLAGGQYGDGVVAFAAGFSDGTMFPATVALEGSLIESSGRAGVGVFGSNLSIANSFVLCNRIPINVEAIGAWNGSEWLPHEFVLTDLGGNVCGCETHAKCSAQSANLRPVPSPTRPEL